MATKFKDTYEFYLTTIAYRLPDGSRKQMICFCRNRVIEICYQETLGM